MRLVLSMGKCIARRVFHTCSCVLCSLYASKRPQPARLATMSVILVLRGRCFPPVLCVSPPPRTLHEPLSLPTPGTHEHHSHSSLRIC
jgi:hypothetical protein